jgi:hypothetical protein
MKINNHVKSKVINNSINHIIFIIIVATLNIPDRSLIPGITGK